MSSLRLFYALWPDDAARSALTDMQSRIRGRKVRRENLHLTLAFLGQQSVDRLPVLKQILADLPAAAVSLPIDRIGYFPRNRIAWAGTHRASNELAELHRCLVRLLIDASISFDNHADFKPHITLARDANAPENLPFDSFTWKADRIVLVESVSGARGATYRLLASHGAA